MRVSKHSRVERSFSVGATAAYAAGSIGTGVYSTVPTVLLLYFSTEILNIPPQWAAVAVFLPKAWSLVWDPFVGAWSDRTVSRHGRRAPFLVAGAAGVTISFVLLFSPPREMPPMLDFAWVTTWYLGLATVYSLFAVPYIAIPAEIATAAATRARLVAARMSVAMVGVLVGAGLAPLIVSWAGGGQHGYVVMAWVLALACGLAMAAPAVLMLRASGSHYSNQGRPKDLVDQVRRVLRSAPFRRLATAYLLQLTAAAALTAAAPYFVVSLFGRDAGDTGIALALLFIVTTVSVPAWSRTGRAMGEERALRLAAVLYGVTAAVLGLIALVRPDWRIGLALTAFAGVPFAGLQVLPFTLVAHLARAESEQSGRAEEGVFTGVWTSIEKLALAVGPALIGVALAFGHGSVRAAAVFVCAVPLALCGLSVLALGPSRLLPETSDGP